MKVCFFNAESNEITNHNKVARTPTHLQKSDMQQKMEMFIKNTGKKEFGLYAFRLNLGLQ